MNLTRLVANFEAATLINNQALFDAYVENIVEELNTIITDGKVNQEKVISSIIEFKKKQKKTPI